MRKLYKKIIIWIITRMLPVLVMVVGVGFSGWGQTTIHYWSFNDEQSSELDAANNQPTTIPADIGDGVINHNLSFNSFGGSEINAETGFIAGSAFCPAGTGNNGESFEIVFSTEGYENIEFSFVAQRTDAGYDNNKIELSSDGGINWETIVDGLNLPDEFALYEYDLTIVDSEKTDNSEVIIRITLDVDQATGGGNNRYDNIKITGLDPTLIANPSTLTNLDYFEHEGPSEPQSFELTGENLDNSDVTVTAPSNFEVAESETGTYNETLTLTAFDGRAKDISVRLVEGLSVGVYNGDITISGGGAEQITVNANGEVTFPPPGIPYTQDFVGFVDLETLPDEWILDDDYTYQGDFGFGIAGGLRGDGVLGFQLTGSSPNNSFKATLNLQNNTGSKITELFLQYNGKVERTDQEGTPKWVVSVNGTEYSELEYSTENGYDKVIGHLIKELSISAGDVFEIEWFTTTEGTSGTRRQIGITDVIVDVNVLTTWLGQNTTWSESNNWTEGVPSDEVNVLIPGVVGNFPTIDSDATVNNLTIEDGASLLGDENLTIAGTFTMERELSAVSYWPEGNDGWHMVSSPVSGQPVSGNWTPEGENNDYDFYAWDESPPGTWLNQKAEENDISTFVPGQGYLVAYETAGTKQFSGDINSGSITFPLSSTAAKEESWEYSAGWNLIGNPYPSGLKWDKVPKDLLEDVFAYVYDSSDKGVYQYIEGGAGNFIAPGQGFFVKAKEKGNIELNNTMRSHPGEAKKSKKTLSDILELRLSGGEFSDNTTLRVIEGTDFERDRRDALKMFSMNPDVPQLYSLTSDLVKVAINSVPEISSGVSFPLGMYIPAGGEYTLSLQDLSGEFEAESLYLVDLKLDTGHILSDNNPYIFNASPDDDPVRFELHFGKAGDDETGIESGLEAMTQIYAHDRTLYLEFARSDASRSLEVFDLSGRSLMQQQLGDGTYFQLPVNLETGVYIISVRSDSPIRNERVIIK